MTVPAGRAPRAIMRAMATALLLLPLAVACRDKGAAPGGGPYASKVAELVPKIEAATGMRFKSTPVVATRSQAEVRVFLEQQFASSRAAKELAGQQQAYRLFGFLEEGTDLKRLFTDLLAEQVVGYYDPKARTLYVVQDAPIEAVSITLMHELVHALQDQYVNVDSIQQLAYDNDRATAAQAVLEGQATFEHVTLMLGGRTLAEGLPGGWDMIRQQIRDNKTSMPRLAAAPMLIQETLLFPYLAGAEYIRSFKAAHPGQSPLTDMPRSTRQVLHSAKFLAGRDSLPLRLVLPAPSGGEVVYANDLGEFETRLWLYQYTKDQGSAGRGAMGWNGDAYQVVKTSRGNALVWLTLWDSNVEAGEFFGLVNETVVTRFTPKDYFRSGEGGRRYVEGGRSMTIRPVTVRGLPGVLWIDAPAGATVDLDIAKVTLSRPR